MILTFQRLFCRLRTCNLFKPTPETPSTKAKMAQSTISFAGALKDQLDYLIGMSIFTNARPFSLFDDIYLRRLLRKLNPDYTPPDRHRISGDTLGKCYERQRILVLQELRNTRYLNITINETTNITNDRMVTLSFNLRDKSLFYCLENFGDCVFDAQAVADWIYSKMESFLAAEGSVGDWNRLNSLSTDATATMRSVCQILSEKPELRHLFCIPCDSHGLQLIIKDLLHLPRIHEAFSVATKIVTYFRSSAKQLASLRTFQQQIYSEARSLLAAVITRQGSQYDMLYSIKRSSEALKAWAVAALSSGDAKVSIIQIILYRKDLWLEIDNLLALLEPLHKAQKASEAQNTDIMMVTKRWLDLQVHFEAQIMVSLFGEDIRSYLFNENSSWFNRFNRQVSPLHWAAYYLHPQNAGDDVPLPSNIISALDKVIEKYAGEGGVNSFYYFRNKEEGFYAPDIWKQKRPLDFWLRAVSLCQL